jgi:hypothetical protein
MMTGTGTGTGTTETCVIHTERIERLMKETDEQWTHINKLEDVVQKLIPAWIALVLMVMSGVTGSALTFAGMIIKFAGSK